MTTELRVRGVADTKADLDAVDAQRVQDNVNVQFHGDLTTSSRDRTGHPACELRV
ncbi:hypothetical protein [Halocatena salina]|uniref:Uncharacterized protein n=1 Tax=Halocatena salina TaxID=2934340 RepID=A0A8U0A686_9EURY|nr:hypothetical protein [Halocatena salina]UPM44691.1 hypothetical protein MW046_16800 [Halocatena salina]